MSYYKKFGIIIGNPLYRKYLNWVYNIHLADLKELDYQPNFSKSDFKCLLCGVGNENTADEFIRFINSKTTKPTIYIIDLAEEQIEAVKKLVKNKYFKHNIIVKKINALNLNELIKKESINWIETDFLLEYFNKESLDKLLSVWYQILAKDGYITTRHMVFSNFLEEMFDKLKILIGRVWLQVSTFSHEKKYFDSELKKHNFYFIEHCVFIPVFRRYSLLKFVKTNLHKKFQHPSFALRASHFATSFAKATKVKKASRDKSEG